MPDSGLGGWAGVESGANAVFAGVVQGNVFTRVRFIKVWAVQRVGAN